MASLAKCGCIPFAEKYCVVHQNWISKTIANCNYNGHPMLPSADLHKDCMKLVHNKGMGKMRIFCRDRIMYEHLDKIVTCRLALREQGYRNRLMASRIQRAFKRAMSNPSYKMCRERLLREFGEGISTT